MQSKIWHEEDKVFTLIKLLNTHIPKENKNENIEYNIDQTYVFNNYTKKILCQNNKTIQKVYRMKKEKNFLLHSL